MTYSEALEIANAQIRAMARMRYGSGGRNAGKTLAQEALMQMAEDQRRYADYLAGISTDHTHSGAVDLTEVDGVWS